MLRRELIERMFINRFPEIRVIWRLFLYYERMISNAYKTGAYITMCNWGTVAEI